MKYEFFVGSYGKKEEESITKFSLDGDTGGVEKIFGYRGVENPSWLILNAGKCMLYAVEELEPEGKVCTFEVEKDGLKFKNSLPTGGTNPCHISTDEKEKYLFVSNYTSGSLTVCRLDENGVAVAVTDFVQHEGYGVNPLRQEGPHIHFTRVRGEKVYAVDLGVDRGYIYELDGGCLKDRGERIGFPGGEGPRHLEFNPEIPGLLYAVCELSNNLAVFRERDGRYVLENMISTLPDLWTGYSKASAIRRCNDMLFVGNRGSDSIAVYVLGEQGDPYLRQIFPIGRKTPRDFEIFGDYVVVANQDSDELTILKINKEKKLLEQTGRSVPVIRPTCICK